MTQTVTIIPHSLLLVCLFVQIFVPILLLHFRFRDIFFGEFLNCVSLCISGGLWKCADLMHAFPLEFLSTLTFFVSVGKKLFADCALFRVGYVDVTVVNYARCISLSV